MGGYISGVRGSESWKVWGVFFLSILGYFGGFFLLGFSLFSGEVCGYIMCWSGLFSVVLVVGMWVIKFTSRLPCLWDASGKSCVMTLQSRGYRVI